MRETIYRDDAIKALRSDIELIDPFDIDRGIKVACVHRASWVIENVPSADSSQDWIPCSITPPELGVDGNVLLYGKDGNYAVGWYNGCYRSWDDRFDMDTPVAWMPLPEPWEGEEHG